MANHIFNPKPLEEILSPEPRVDRKRVDWRGRAGEPKPLWAILGEDPPIGWRLEQEGTASRQSSVAPMQLAQASGTDAAGNTTDAVLVPLDVPGFGRTYFNPEVAPRVRDFIARTQQAGMNVQFESGFRTTSGQTGLLRDPSATTPAAPGNSLHEAGRAFDISLYPKMADGRRPRISDEELRKIVELGQQAGFNWGGNFRKPDPGHFFIEVPEGIGNRGPRIQGAQEFYRKRLETK